MFFKIIEVPSCGPSVICSKCLENLKVAVQFRNACRKSDRHFQKLNQKEEQERWEKEIAAIKKEDEGVVAQQEVSKNESSPQQLPMEAIPAIKCEALFDDSSNDEFNGFDDDFFASAFDEPPRVNQDQDKTDKKGNIKALNNSLMCHICSKQLANKNSLNKHLKRHNIKDNSPAGPTGPVDNELQCKQCYKIFASMKSLKKHEWRHKNTTSKNKIKCNKCPASFTSLFTLEVHIGSVHDSDGDYICNVGSEILI